MYIHSYLEEIVYLIYVYKYTTYPPKIMRPIVTMEEMHSIWTIVPKKSGFVLMEYYKGPIKK